MKTFDSLFTELSERITARPEGSGTVAAFDKGVHHLGKKVIEEAGEVWIAAEHQSDEDLAEEAWIVLPGGAGATLPNRLNTLAMNAGFVPRIVQVAPDSWTLVVLVGAGMGISLILSSVRDNVPSRGVVYKPLTQEQKPVEVRLLWRRGDANPALQSVIEISETVFPAPGGPLPAPATGTP